jgi:RNA polymerase sigma-70 factor (ECF subfamily)
VLHLPILWTREKRAVASADLREMKVKLTSDEALMEVLKGNNPHALAELFLRYSRFVFSIGLRILQDAGEAEEIVQEVFLYLYQKANQFDQSKGSAKGWIAQITHSRSIDRRKFLQRRYFYAGTDVEDFTDTLAGAHDVHRELVAKWNLDQLQIALGELPDRQRRTLEMFFFEGLELKEIAERLGESLENVRHYYYRGLQKLRKNDTVRKLKRE